ncbi:HipA family kinase [Dyella telluris]|uniref:Aminotransferase class I and II n=1 Tax=Dyella telluris TaxID=2763498 RepID=A0A7G8Q643_9GAMM|nr:HipA family kinase [Dyella telluris]QNK02251.1 aminotransferase class I and II [Dyella telluris]
MTPRQIHAARYVTPLREGGSLPAVIEGDDDGLYVLKFRGAGQGAKALVAEWIAGSLARACGLPVPEIVFVELDADLARTEPDPEIQDLIRASAGLNLALDYLPGAINFDPVAEKVDCTLASQIVWFDALVSNVDRTARNPNLMMWHNKLYLIDHGAALYFHHAWNGHDVDPTKPFPIIRDHVLLSSADRLAEIDAVMAERLAPAVIEDIVGAVPDIWLQGPDAFADAATQRAAYKDYLVRRLKAPRAFVQGAIDARA